MPEILEKRINPLTGKYFKKGDFNDDRTERFVKYEVNKWDGGDFCREHWLISKSYDEIFTMNSDKSIRRRCMTAKGGAKRRSKINKVPFNLTAHYLFTIWPEDNKCPVFNVEFSALGESFTPFSPTLDRIIPELGYVKGNVVWISRKANSMKSDGSLDELKKVYEWLKKRTENIENN